MPTVCCTRYRRRHLLVPIRRRAGPAALPYDLVIARLVEPTSKADAARVWSDLGAETVLCRMIQRHLAKINTGNYPKIRSAGKPRIFSAGMERINFVSGVATAWGRGVAAACRCPALS